MCGMMVHVFLMQSPHPYQHCPDNRPLRIPFLYLPRKEHRGEAARWLQEYYFYVSRILDYNDLLLLVYLTLQHIAHA